MSVTTTKIPQSAPPAARSGSDERVATLGMVTRLLQRPELGALLGAIAVFILFALADATPNHFWLSWAEVRNWTAGAAEYGIVGVAVALLMIGGEFDLSTGVMVGSTGVVMGLLMSKWHWNAWAAIGGVVVFATLIGLINGLVVVKTKLPSFIVTLATFFVLRGANVGMTSLINGSETVIVDADNPPSGYTSVHAVFGGHFTSTPAPGYSNSLLWWLGITIAATWLLTRTTFGNWIFAAGGDANSARNVGVPVNRTKILLFIGTAMAAGLLGVIHFSSINQVSATEGPGQEFFYIIAAVVGGCLLTGGYGSAIGASLGACVVGMDVPGVIAAHWNQDWQYTFLGVILFLAVVVNTYIRRRAMSARK